MATPLIAVPDDFPSVFEGSAAHEKCRTIGELRLFSVRGADEEAELIKRIGRASVAINIRAHANFSEGVFAACPRLKMVSVWGTGVDNIDLTAAGRRGVTICNTPGVNAFAVAEHVIALMLAVARRIPRIDREMREGQWPREQLVQCLGKTLGVAGTGKIGARVIEIGKALGMTVIAYSARGDSAHVAGLGARAVSKDELLRESDFLSLCLRLASETRGFLSRRDFTQMKKSAILVNTGRGALIEREALLDALSTGKISAAGLDVFHEEPTKPDDPLFAMPNVVLSPHHAGQTPEVVRDGLLAAVKNVENYLAGKPTDAVVEPVR